MISSTANPRRSARFLPAPFAGNSPRSSRSRQHGQLTLEAFFMALSFVGSLLGSAYWIHPAWSLAAFVNYIWLCTVLFRLEPRGTVLILPQLINNASAMVAMIMIEFGAEMFELGLVGRPGPWSSALAICNLMFCAGFVVAVRPLLKMLDRRSGTEMSLVLDRFANLVAIITLALAGMMALALIFRGLQAGFPLLAGTDRFLFRRFSADKVTLYALNLKFVIGYALGFVAFVVPATRWLRIGAGLMFALLMIIYFLFGDKFFTQLSALSAFAAPYLYYHHRKISRRIWVYALSGLLALSGVMGMTTYIYSKGFTETSAATTKKLSGRMVGQGELWYLQSSIGAPVVDWNAPLIERYLQSLSVKSIDLFAVQNSLGPNYFSNRYAPDYLRASLQRNAGSVTYTAVTEAMGLVLFGWLGLGVLMFVLGGFLGLACAYIAYAIESRSILSGLFAAYIYVQLRTSIIQATPWVIASVYSARWLVLILAIELALLVLARGGARSGRRSRRNQVRSPRSIQPTAKPSI
jgi:hypothetical protein